MSASMYQDAEKAYCYDCGQELEEERLKELQKQGIEDEYDWEGVHYHEMEESEEPFVCEECELILTLPSLPIPGRNQLEDLALYEQMRDYAQKNPFTMWQDQFNFLAGLSVTETLPAVRIYMELRARERPDFAKEQYINLEHMYRFMRQDPLEDA